VLAERNNVGAIQFKAPARILRVTLIATLLALSLDCISVSAQVPNAAALSAEIDTKSAREVVNRLGNSPHNAGGENNWSRLVEQMWNGHAAYIALAPKLAPGTDAGTAEDLGIALAHALPLVPSAVLSAIDPNNGPVLGVRRVCGVPFIEGTVKDIPGYIRAAQSSAGKVTSPQLQAVKAACLKQLNEAAKPPPSSK
jgi:hypothetical protein